MNSICLSLYDELAFGNEASDMMVSVPVLVCGLVGVHALAASPAARPVTMRAGPAICGADGGRRDLLVVGCGTLGRYCVLEEMLGGGGIGEASLR